MKVKALCVWNDLKEGVQRKPGEVFVVTKERYEEICAYRDDLVAPCEPAPAKKRTRRTTRKTKQQ